MVEEQAAPHRWRCLPMAGTSCSSQAAQADVSDLAAAGRHPGGDADSGNRRRDLPVLVAGQPVHRVLRGWQTEESRDRRRTTDRAVRRAVGARRELEPRQRDSCSPRALRRRGLLRVSSAGGVPTVVTTLDPATGEDATGGRTFCPMAGTSSIPPLREPAVRQRSRR